LNCHLQAGPQGGRRVRQINEGVKASFNLAKKLKEPDPSNPLLVICGDFNGGSECGAVHFLEAGKVDETFIEDGEPVSSKEKKSPIANPFVDVAASVPGRDAPPTLVVSELISQMVKGANDDDDDGGVSKAYERPELSQGVLDRLQRCYQKYATTNGSEEELVMNIVDVERWLVDINRLVGRGDEFRNAAREMGWTEPPEEEETENGGGGGNGNGEKKKKARIELPKDGILTLQGFQNVYQKELRGGKFWGIAHDLFVMGEALPQIGLFEARYDRMYCTTALHPTAVLDTVAAKPCPNEEEPSDHLPVAATFQIAAELN
jgi:hypothetical protein